MKKKLLLITLIFFVSNSSTILAQTEQRLRVKELEFDGVKKDEYLGDKLISIDDLQAKTKAKCTEFRCEGYENISFKKYDIQHTLRMEKLIRSIQGKAIRDWLFIQEKIVKTELDKINFTKTTSKYGDHYKAARGIYFEKLERGITKNNLNYYNRSYGNSIKSKKTKGTSIMKDIKRLTLRRQEIKNGNINNSSYGSYKYKGKPLSYYKSLKEVSNLLKSELLNYYNNDVAINDNQRIKNRLNQMIKDMSPSSVSKDLMLKRKNFFIDLLNRKESHFKSFSNWNELNLMQKYINKVYKGNNPGTVWPKDFGTKKFVLSHAKSKKLGSLTVFHPNYWKVILKNKYKNSWLYNSKAKADHAKLKQAEINKLIASTPINANLAVDFIVKDIKITDLNQLEWLNSIPEKEANRIKGILQMAKTSWGSDLDLGSIYRQKKEIEIERIKNAGLVVQMVKTLGITNSTQKSWLYNNIPEATQIRFFVDANKIRGVVKTDAKTLAVEAIKSLMNNYIKLNINELIELLKFEQDYKNRMSSSEKVIFESISRNNQLGYLFNAQKAIWKAEELFPNSLYNGKGDAFRHAYFNGLNAILLGNTLAESLATAHEDRTAPMGYSNYYKEKQMDLFNNQIGRDRKNWLFDGYSSLTKSILDALKTGKLRYLSNLKGGAASGRATNLSKLTPTNK